MIKGYLIETRLAYNKAMELKPEPIYPTGSGFTRGFGLPFHYFTTGYFEKAHELIMKLVQADPLNIVLRGIYLYSYYLLGDTQRAEEEYDHGNILLFDDDWWLGDACITKIRLSSKDFVSRDDIVFSHPIFDVAKEHLESPEKGIMELRRLYANNGNLSGGTLMHIAIWAAYFGDPACKASSIVADFKIKWEVGTNIGYHVFAFFQWR